MRRFRLAALLLTLLLGACAAAAGTPEFDLRIMIGTTCLGAGLIFLVKRERELHRWQFRVDTALWGPEDANGKRNVEAGVVAVVSRIDDSIPRLEAMVESTAASAATAADAARTAQRIILDRFDPRGEVRKT